MARFFLHVLAAAAVMALAGAMMDNSAQALSQAMKHMVPSDFAYKPPASNEVTLWSSSMARQGLGHRVMQTIAYTIVNPRSTSAPGWLSSISVSVDSV